MTYLAIALLVFWPVVIRVLIAAIRELFVALKSYVLAVRSVLFATISK